MGIECHNMCISFRPSAKDWLGTTAIGFSNEPVSVL